MTNVIDRTRHFCVEVIEQHHGGRKYGRILFPAIPPLKYLTIVQISVSAILLNTKFTVDT